MHTYLCAGSRPDGLYHWSCKSRASLSGSRESSRTEEVAEVNTIRSTEKSQAAPTGQLVTTQDLGTWDEAVLNAAETNSTCSVFQVIILQHQDENSKESSDAACCSVDRRRSGGDGILYSSEHSHSPGDSGQVPADGNPESPGAKARL